MENYTDTLLTELRGFALDLAREAGAITLRYFGGAFDVETKSDDTPVTRADREAEELVRARIGSTFPEDAILGEEFGSVPGTSGRTWVVDPIDGTKSFVAGVPLYAVLVALVDGPVGDTPFAADRVQVGVIHVPPLGESLAAARGCGALWFRARGADATRLGAGGQSVGMDVADPSFPRAERAGVSTVGSIDRARITTSDFADLHRREPRLAAGLDARSPLARTWGDAYGYLLVATGRMEAMIDPIVSPWDIAPMPVIIEEAGGRYTDLAGDAVVGASGVATNGLLHDGILGVRRA